jgi:hypothetical protein
VTSGAGGLRGWEAQEAAGARRPWVPPVHWEAGRGRSGASRAQAPLGDGEVRERDVLDSLMFLRCS